ncbi:MAG: SH3 domain-containing protein [Eubacterium sp.]|nr:SH3 domain-containing protein [Eubacterium sp.]
MRNRPLKLAACCMAGTLLTTVPAYQVLAAPSAGISEYTSTILGSELNTSSVSAGVSTAVAGYLEESLASQRSSVEATQPDSVKASSAEASKSKAKKVSKEAKKSSQKEDQTDYKNMAVAQVNDYVNIRKKPDENAKLLGKLYSNAVATVIRKQGDWYKIRSGSVTGYVKGDFVVVGDEKLIKSVGVQIAKVNTTTLKVRSKASKKSEVLTLVPGGEELEVSSMKSFDDGWVKVAVEEGDGFVSSDYVDISREYTYAESRAEEEARLAIEQARIEAEEAARRAQEAAAAGSTSTGTSSDSSSAGSSDSTSSGSTSSSGQSVVNYASQFLGNPYVYGGTSLTNGADCSGFVMSVYAHFGVSLPHSSNALRGAGYGVSYSSMQPGDIICYDGHVAIYAGGNTVIHASNPADGIKYTSPANYRSVVAVRRIF